MTLNLKTNQHVLQEEKLSNIIEANILKTKRNGYEIKLDRYGCHATILKELITTVNNFKAPQRISNIRKKRRKKENISTPRASENQ